MTVGGGRWRLPVIAGAALLAVYLLGAWAVWFTPPSGSVAFWWPAAGVAVTILAIAPRTWWPALVGGIVTASFAANITGGRSFDVAAAFALANAAEAVVAGHLLKRADGRLIELEQLRDFVRLVGAAVAGALVVALLAGATVALNDIGPFLATARSLFTSHAAAVLVIVPVAMTWRLRAGIAERWEYSVQIALLLAVTLAIFVPQHELPIAAAGLPLLVWAALRLDPRTVTLEILGSSVIAVLLTAAGRGPYGELGQSQETVQLSATLVLGYILTSALIALPLTLAITQRVRDLDTLSESEALFRRNFTESLTGMLLLSRRGNRLEVVDANETAHALLDDGDRSVVGRYLDRVLTQPTAVRGVTQTMLRGNLDGWRGQLGIIHQPESQVDVAISQLTAGDDDEAVFAAQLLDVTPLHQSLARTQAAEQLTNALLDTARCIMIMTDMAGTVVRVNQATAVLTGYAEDELLGQPLWARIIPVGQIEETQEMFAGPDGKELPGSRESDLRTASGDPLRVLWNTDLVRHEDGSPQYAVMTGVDVTAERAGAGLMANLFQAGISTAILGIDAQGRIRVLNSGAESLLGCTSEELQGRQFVDVLDPEELRERTDESAGSGWSALASTLEGGNESVVRDWTWRTVQGRRRTVEMTICGGGSQFGPLAGFLVVGRDVTEQRQGQLMLITALEKERLAADRLRQLDTAKNEFVSTVSHELRTPVTSIVGYTEMLADGSPVPADPQQLPLLETIARNGDRLILLCNDLLALAGIDSGGTVWDRSVVDLCELAHQTEESLRPMVRNRDLIVDFELPAAPVPVLGDAVQLERVMLNLLSNAVKFTPDHGRVSTRLWEADGEAWLTVADSGIGIPQEEQDGLFQKFFRSSTAQAMAIQGTGLGLSIVAGIVAAHGGRIAVDSTLGEGSTFSVRLPLHVT
ncbi:MAG: ATP-binding protein [Nocardioides sp.]